MVGEDADRPDRPNRTVRVYWECLPEDLVRMAFKSHLWLHSAGGGGHGILVGLVPEVKGAIKLKKDPYKAWLACGT